MCEAWKEFRRSMEEEKAWKQQWNDWGGGGGGGGGQGIAVQFKE
jgi:hypothetical protein